MILAVNGIAVTHLMRVRSAWLWSDANAIPVVDKPNVARIDAGIIVATTLDGKATQDRYGVSPAAVPVTDTARDCPAMFALRPKEVDVWARATVDVMAVSLAVLRMVAVRGVMPTVRVVTVKATPPLSKVVTVWLRVTALVVLVSLREALTLALLSDTATTLLVATRGWPFARVPGKAVASTDREVQVSRRA